MEEYAEKVEKIKKYETARSKKLGEFYKLQFQASLESYV